MKRIFNIVDEQWKLLPWQALLLLFAVPFLIRNLLLPMLADDFSYAFIWDGEHMGNLMDDISERERVDSLHDILVSQWSHYFTWGGRTPSMLCIQFFAWVGKVWFDIANTIVFVLLMLTLYWLAVGSIVSPGRHKGVFLWVMVCMLFGVIDYPSTMLWMTGACVYLWTGLCECLFLLFLSVECRVLNVEFATAIPSPNRPAVANSKLYTLNSKPNKAVANSKLYTLNSTLILPFALLAGWSEEAGSLVTLLLTAYLLFVSWRRGQLTRWMVVAFVFLLIGTCLLMLAPGSIHREELMLEYAPEYVLPADKLFTFEMFWDNFTEGFLPILLWESFLFIPIVIYYSHTAHRTSLHSTVTLFTAAGLLVLCAMMMAPEFALRTGFHSTMFLTVASAAALRQIGPWLKRVLVATPLRRMATLAVGTVCTVYALLVMAGCFYVEGSYRQQFDERLSYVNQHRDADSLVVKAFHIPHDVDKWLGPRSLTDFHLIYGADLESKSTDNRSLMYARYYHLPPIRIDREVDWKKKNN